MWAVPEGWIAITRVSRGRSCVKDMATKTVVVVALIACVLCNVLRIILLVTCCCFPTEDPVAGLNLFLPL